MRIGFDLDKVLIDYPPLIPDTLVDRLYKKKSNGVLLYRYPSYPEQIVRDISHLPFFRPAITANINVLKNISRKNNKLYLVSSRYHFLEKRTNTIVKKYGLDAFFDGMYFNFRDKQPHKFKDEVIKKLRIDMYVDDDLPLLEYVAKKNPQTKFFWLNATAQKRMKEKNILQVSHLSDVFH